MNAASPLRGLQLRTLVRPEGVVELSLQTVDVPPPADDEVVIEVQASPINPSDIGNLFGAADLGSVQVSGTGAQAIVRAAVSPAGLKGMAGRVGQSMTAGNEGAGRVVQAGASAAAQALLGRTVAVMGGSMYAQYRTARAEDCLVLPPGTTAAQGASCFINPLTALGFLQTMQREGHTALVHTAAASNLGQMLNRLCLKDGVALVNIVRSPAQVALLKSQGARHVCDMSSPGFTDELTQALVDTGATLGFDATGGGPLAGQILTCMEVALNRNATEYSRYGSPVHKQVYLYGSLDHRPTEFRRAFGMSWGLGGWLVFPYLQRLGPQALQALKQRVADELLTTFASHYVRQVSLAQMLQADVIAEFAQRRTGAKVLLVPSAD